MTNESQHKGRTRAIGASSIPAVAVLSFLKDTKGILTWSVRHLAESLGINRHEAQQVIPFLEAQGYVQRAKEKGEWMTTAAGESVSGAKAPRFTRESVEQAVAALKDRIKSSNADRKLPFRISNAVAFGDFLVKDRIRVQAADVGIGLAKRGNTEGDLRSASDARAEGAFLRDLRGKTALLNIKPYADWMKKRSHLELL